VVTILEAFSADNIVCSEGFCRTNRILHLKPNGFYNVVVRAYNLQASFNDVPSSDLRVPDIEGSGNVVIMLLVLTSVSAVFWLAMLLYTEWYAPQWLCEKVHIPVCYRGLYEMV
jgi:hypothetical protein